MNKSENRIYKVIFANREEVFEVFARYVYPSDMYGFVEVEEYIFGERSKLLVDPSEERLKAEFAQVKRSYIPMQAIIRIDEVEKEGVAKVRGSSDKLAAFPGGK
ncbi:MAG TPA: DUF1820 domain-containing protein [Oceanospirillaceae bacterium]|nr:DUF1820 domain-containing protein [Oceanospirillaceae bacterium]